MITHWTSSWMLNLHKMRFNSPFYIDQNQIWYLILMFW